MAKDLKYYSNLSKQLGQEIEILESSYQDFEKAIDVNNFKIRDLTEEQRRILGEFGTFSKEEGFSKDGRIRVETYNDVKSSIVERVEFLKKQKEINDKMLSLHQELNKLKKDGTLSDADVKGLENSVAKRYDEGTEKYHEELKKAKKKLVAKRIEETNESISKTNEEVKKNKKENGLGKVVSSVFGSVGNKIYNAYAKVFNWDLKNYKKNKVGNIALKAGLGVGSLFLLNAIAPAIGTTLAAVIALGALGVTAYSIYKVAKKDAQFLPLKNDKKISLREAWKRFRKSRGKGELSVEKKLYNGIDFSKYEKKDSGTDGTPELKEEDKKDKPSELEKDDKKDETSELSEEDKKDVTPELPEDDKGAETPELPEDDKKDETPELTDDDKGAETPELPEDDKKDGIPELKEDDKEDKTPVVEENKSSRYSKENKERLIKMKEMITIQKETKKSFGKKCSNIEDVNYVLKRYTTLMEKYENGELFKIDGNGNKIFVGNPNYVTNVFYDLINAKRFLSMDTTNARNVNDMLEALDKIILEDFPLDILNIANQNLKHMQTFGVGKEKDSDNLNDRLLLERERAFNSLMDLIYDNDKLDQSVIETVNEFKRIYKFSSRQLEELDNALSQREKFIMENMGRGK